MLLYCCVRHLMHSGGGITDEQTNERPQLLKQIYQLILHHLKDSISTPDIARNMWG